MTRSSRAAFIVAALLAAVPLLVLAAAAPGGGKWVWLEYPRHMTMLALMLGIACCFAKARPTALVVLAGTVFIAVAAGALVGGLIGWFATRKPA